MNNIIINNKPDASLTWRGLGGHFDSITQIINEFMDNSISNLKSHPELNIKQIFISIQEINNGDVTFSIEDSGTGFTDLDAAFTLGSQEAQDSTMNEHGFGFKHALASVDPDNINWKIYSRSKQQLENGMYTLIEAPYSYTDFTAKEVSNNEKKWPGLSNSSGTIFTFMCSKLLFKTVRVGVRGTPPGFERHIEYLVEDLAFTYSDLISDNKAPIRVIAKDMNGVEVCNQTIAALEPDVYEHFNLGKGSQVLSLDNHSVTVKYEFCFIHSRDDTVKYYKTTMSQSGVEIRLNGRVIAYNLFKEIWDKEKHNSYNHILIKLNLISDDQNALPSTRTSKNGIRKGDKKLDDLFTWLLQQLPEGPPQSTEPGGGQHETSLFELLKDQKEIHLVPSTIKLDRAVFDSLGYNKIRVDLWQSYNQQLKIYEGKKDVTTLQDVYQLMMYWDGCVIDGHTPHTGYLIAASHPQSVKDLLITINTMKDASNNNYNFETTTWKKNGVNYPK